MQHRLLTDKINVKYHRVFKQMQARSQDFLWMGEVRVSSEGANF